MSPLLVHSDWHSAEKHTLSPVPRLAGARYSLIMPGLILQSKIFKLPVIQGKITL